MRMASKWLLLSMVSLWLNLSAGMHTQTYKVNSKHCPLINANGNGNSNICGNFTSSQTLILRMAPYRFSWQYARSNWIAQQMLIAIFQYADLHPQCGSYTQHMPMRCALPQHIFNRQTLFSAFFSLQLCMCFIMTKNTILSTTVWFRMAVRWWSQQTIWD